MFPLTFVTIWTQWNITSRYTCPCSFLIHLCSVVTEEWDHNWNLFRAMVSPPCWVLQQSDFIQDFISSLSFCINRKKGGWKNTLAEVLWQKALIFVIASQWVRASVIAETSLLPVPTRVSWLEGRFLLPQAWPGEERSFTAHCYHRVFLPCELEPVQRCPGSSMLPSVELIRSEAALSNHSPQPSWTRYLVNISLQSCDEQSECIPSPSTTVDTFAVTLQHITVAFCICLWSFFLHYAVDFSGGISLYMCAI